ncbi:MAG: hypothetical protein ACJAYJ_004447 [Saprospiraceae bacterium]|jgi:hypothetical protein
MKALKWLLLIRITLCFSTKYTSAKTALDSIAFRVLVKEKKADLTGI